MLRELRAWPTCFTMLLGCTQNAARSTAESTPADGTTVSTSAGSMASSGTTGGAVSTSGGGTTSTMTTTDASASSVTTGGASSSEGVGGGSGGTASSSTRSGGTTGAAGGSGGLGGEVSGGNVDVFGIEELYPSASNGGLWTSEHWATYGPYSITERTDENDPLGVSGYRGTGTLDVTEDGVLVMGGSQPRLYIYESEFGPWRDVEITVYYQRVADDATAWGGLVIGARSGPDGHGETPCDAHTYYSRLRHDGATDFEKELMHTPSSTKSRVEPEVLWPPDGQLPFDTWIGYKYVIYNQAGGDSVRFESYRDLTQGAEGGTWELVNETVDDGGWFTQTTCEEHDPVNGESDLVYLGSGATLIRNTGVTEARYRWVSIREIAPE